MWHKHPTYYVVSCIISETKSNIAYRQALISTKTYNNSTFAKRKFLAFKYHCF